SDAVGSQAPQLLVTGNSAFYAELAIGIDVGTTAVPRVVPAADGRGSVEVNRAQTASGAPGAFQSVAVELKGKVTAGEIWTLRIRDVSVPGSNFVAVAHYKT